MDSKIIKGSKLKVTNPKSSFAKIQTVTVKKIVRTQKDTRLHVWAEEENRPDYGYGFIIPIEAFTKNGGTLEVIG